jgi:DNA-binding PadR family transcriptional regulator
MYRTDTSCEREVPVLEMAILGLLQEAPMHGYELRKELAAKLGTLRAAISYGTLYPTLKRLLAARYITEQAPGSDIPPPMTSKRGRIVYKITAEGKERFAALLAAAGPETYDDAGFGVHFTFFSRTDRATRLRILEGRRRRIEERREGLREMLARAGDRLDTYTLELQRHGLDSADREVRWLEELITRERSGTTPTISATAPVEQDATTTAVQDAATTAVQDIAAPAQRDPTAPVEQDEEHTSPADQAAEAPPGKPAPHLDRP